MLKKIMMAAILAAGFFSSCSAVVMPSVEELREQLLVGCTTQHFLDNTRLVQRLAKKELSISDVNTIFEEELAKYCSELHPSMLSTIRRSCNCLRMVLFKDFAPEELDVLFNLKSDGELEDCASEDFL